MLESHTYTQSDIGHVMIRGPYISDYYDAGVPEQGAWVVGLTISGGKAYALACNMTTGVYNVYSTTDLTPSAPPPTVGGAKNSTTGVPASFSGIVTLPFPNDLGGNYMYVESPDRSAGIRVMTNDFGNPGFRVLVQGTTMLVNGEATITGSSITIDGIEEPLRPLHVTHRSIGGASPGVQSAVAPGAGLSTIGLLVTLTGKLTEYMPSDPSGIAFRIDDGSGALPGSAAVPGIKVLGIPPSANTGAMLQVKGVIGVEMDGSTPVPVVRPQIGDVTLISEP